MHADPLTFVGATELEGPEHFVVPSPEQQAMDEPSYEVLEEAPPTAELPSGVRRRAPELAAGGAWGRPALPVAAGFHSD